MDSTPGPSSAAQPSDELLDLIRGSYLELLAQPDPASARDGAARLAAAAARHGFSRSAQLLPVIRAAWAALPDTGAVAEERREALLHEVTSALIATHYESR